ncbi:MAG: type ISP restriction/modification enzyme [Ktedonobacteraceae bacterium]
MSFYAMQGMPPPTPSSSTTLNAATLRKAIGRYYRELDEYKGKADYELALRSAFQNLLADGARHVGWTLIPEQTIEGGIRPDGVMRDANNLRRGYWEAKGPESDLDKEIAIKIKKNYPLTNTIFENTRRAVLYQGKRKVFDLDMTKIDDVQDVLQQFLTYTEPHIEKFQTAVLEFKRRIPELAHDLLNIIEKEHRENKRFITAFLSLATICRQSLDPNLDDKAIDEMLVQHLLTERIFRTVFNNPDFVNRNVIAAEIEKVIAALTSRSFNRQEFLKHLDRYYVAIEGTARGIESWSERQEFLNTVYEGFFQGFSVKQADTHGIVYTPQEIVDFMCNSVEEVLKREFGTSIAEPGVQILDPCVGTGSFIVNLVRHHIPRSKLKHKYQNDLFCNEIMLLPYYIASLNIEHEYYERMNEYLPFEGICFADTLELAQGQQLSMFVEQNTERVQREKDAQIMVVIGNPPYNAWQRSENDNNKNRRYPVIDGRIRETYTKGSKAINNRAVSDAYVKFFRWATDRLGNHDGIVCLVTNNGFLDGIAFDMFRKCLAEEFTHIYHVDLGGNARKHGGGNVFGIMVGVGITILVRKREGINSPDKPANIMYHKVINEQSSIEKLITISKTSSIYQLECQTLQPDDRFTWITENLQSEFDAENFVPIGTKEAKASRLEGIKGTEVKTIFKTYSPGVQTNRDSWMYDFDASKVAHKAQQMIETYNSELSRWIRAGCPKDIDNFVLSDASKIKWSSRLKECFQRKIEASFKPSAIRNALYRPFIHEYLYFDKMMTHRQGLFPTFFPAPFAETENGVICVAGVGGRLGFGCLVTNIITDVDLAFEKAECFPYYTYAEDGSNRRENITDWALAQFQAKYGAEVTKWDIFHYVYALLHHPQYRERYAENLKRDLPHIPLLHRGEAFQTCARVGKQLMELHLHYEQASEYPLQEIENPDVPFSYRVEKMRLTPDRAALVVNPSLTLAGIPPRCFAYRLGNRSALEWVIDQYQVSEDKRSGIVSDPNNLDDEEYIVRLVRQIVTVSLETVQLVDELRQAVTMDDWM